MSAASVRERNSGEIAIGCIFVHVEEEELHEVSTPDVLSGGPSWSGLYGPVSWLIFFSLSPTVLLGIVRENLLGLPLWRYDTRVSGPWLPQEMWFRPLLGGGMR